MSTRGPVIPFRKRPSAPRPRQSGSARETVIAAWGENAPDWVLRLADECDRSSQSKIAARLNRSAALVSTVLRRKYPGDMTAVEEVVRGVFMGGTVACPAQGTISTAICRDWMRLAGSYSNETSERVRMRRACRACARFRGSDPVPADQDRRDG